MGHASWIIKQKPESRKPVVVMELEWTHRRKKPGLRISHNSHVAPSISITPEILRLIAGLDEFKGQWRVISSLSSETLTSLHKAARVPNEQ